MDGDDRRKRLTARQWLVVQIVAALLGVLLLAGDVVWKLAAGWFNQENPPIWLYLPPRGAGVIVLVWFAWRTWLALRSSGGSTPPTT